MQSGVGFTYRRRDGAQVVERSVYCAQEDARWHFQAVGPPLPEEPLERYSAPRTRDRLNEASMMGLLRRLDAEPWNDSFYAVPEREIFMLQRLLIPATITVRAREDVLSSRRLQVRQDGRPLICNNPYGTRPCAAGTK